jgi:DNA-binding response OmpR family regulator
MNILIAEDDPIAERILVASLERLGHTVAVAHDGEEAWERFLQHPVPVVITDWMMPRVDGLEVCRRIRARVSPQYTYVIMLTALHGKDRFLAGMEAGADDFLTKPLDRQGLQARLRVAERILSLQAEIRQLQGLLPICSYCKRIRDEGDHWSDLEHYISERTHASFSHGMCPACIEKHVMPALGALEQSMGNHGP